MNPIKTILFILTLIVVAIQASTNRMSTMEKIHEQRKKEIRLWKMSNGQMSMEQLKQFESQQKRRGWSWSIIRKIKKFSYL